MPEKPTPCCPWCGERVEFDGGLWHCDTDGAWDRESLIWTDAVGRIVDGPDRHRSDAS